MDNMMDGLYIAPAFMDKLVVHVAKNFMNLPNIKVDSITIFFPPLYLLFVVFCFGGGGGLQNPFSLSHESFIYSARTCACMLQHSEDEKRR
jgi:hypothetical protein